MYGDVVLVTKGSVLEEAVSLARCLYPHSLKVIKVSRWFRPSTKYYLTRPLLDEVKNYFNGCNGVRKLLIIYDELKPRHKVNLTKELGVEVIEKIELILQIFALHAGSREAKLQIEMARITHQLPLIKEWIRRAKLGELPGFLGPGAYAVDTYYKHMKRRLARIRRELMELRNRRSKERDARRRYGWPQVAITGYANAGKTTLFNKLTNECKPVGPEMFTTLTPKAKGVYLDGLKVIFVDTVGFIRDIPTEVIEAFYATLEEVSSSDLAILVVDSSEPDFIVRDKVRASLNTLFRIGYMGKPLIIALNKIDKVTIEESSSIKNLVDDIVGSMYPWSYSIVPISAMKGHNLELLKSEVIRYIRKEETRDIRTTLRS